MEEPREKGAGSDRRYTTISIPQPLYLEIKRAIEGTGFRSPTEYLVYVARLSLQAQRPAAAGPPASPPPHAGIGNPLMASVGRAPSPLLGR
jgi:hypothetical protein